MTHKENAQHTAESMHIRHYDILPLVKARAKNHPSDLLQLERELGNNNSNKRCKEAKRFRAVAAAIKGDFRNCHQLVEFLGPGFNDVSVMAWLKRYIQGGVDRLRNDAHAGGTPSVLGIEFLLVIEAILCFQPNYFATLACYFRELPVFDKLAGRMLWTRELLADVLGLAPSTVGKFVKQLEIGYFSKRNDKKEYCFSTDPDFIGKTILVDLLRKFGSKLGFDLWSFDEKTCIQAIKREQAINAGGELITLDRYVREGCSHLFGLLHPSTGKVFARFSDTKSGDDVKDFIRAFLTEFYPKDGRKLVILMDNLGVHAAIPQLKSEFPNLIIVFIPTNASWMNPIELFFGVLTKGALKNQSFTSVDALKQHVLDYIDGYNKRAKPVKWDFNVKRCLNQRLNSIACLKQAFPNLDQLIKLGQSTLSQSAVAVCEFAHKAANMQSVFAYAGNGDVEGVTLIPSEIVDTIDSRFINTPHGLDAYHPSSAVQRRTAGLDGDASFRLSDEVQTAYKNRHAAKALIEKLLKLLPDLPYHKKPERKLTQDVINKLESKVTKIEVEVESIKGQEAEWNRIVDDLKSNQGASDSSEALKNAISNRNKVIRRRINLEERLERNLAELQKKARRYANSVTATDSMFKGMLERLIERMKLAFQLWHEHLAQYKAKYAKPKRKAKRRRRLTSEVVRFNF